MLQYCHQSCLRISTILVLLIGCDLAVISRRHFAKPKRPQQQLKNEKSLRRQQKRQIVRRCCQQPQQAIQDHALSRKAVNNHNNSINKGFILDVITSDDRSINNNKTNGNTVTTQYSKDKLFLTSKPFTRSGHCKRSLKFGYNNNGYQCLRRTRCNDKVALSVTL